LFIVTLIWSHSIYVLICSILPFSPFVTRCHDLLLFFTFCSECLLFAFVYFVHFVIPLILGVHSLNLRLRCLLMLRFCCSFSIPCAFTFVDHSRLVTLRYILFSLHYFTYLFLVFVEFVIRFARSYSDSFDSVFAFYDSVPSFVVTFVVVVCYIRSYVFFFFWFTLIPDLRYSILLIVRFAFVDFFFRFICLLIPFRSFWVRLFVGDLRFDSFDLRFVPVVRFTLSFCVYPDFFFFFFDFEFTFFCVRSPVTTFRIPVPRCVCVLPALPFSSHVWNSATSFTLFRCFHSIPFAFGTHFTFHSLFCFARYSVVVVVVVVFDHSLFVVCLLILPICSDSSELYNSDFTLFVAFVVDGPSTFAFPFIRIPILHSIDFTLRLFYVPVPDHFHSVLVTFCSFALIRCYDFVDSTFAVSISFPSIYHSITFALLLFYIFLFYIRFVCSTFLTLLRFTFPHSTFDVTFVCYVLFRCYVCILPVDHVVAFSRYIYVRPTFCDPHVGDSDVCCSVLILTSFGSCDFTPFLSCLRSSFLVSVRSLFRCSPLRLVCHSTFVRLRCLSYDPYVCLRPVTVIHHSLFTILCWNHVPDSFVTLIVVCSHVRCFTPHLLFFLFSVTLHFTLCVYVPLLFAFTLLSPFPFVDSPVTYVFFSLLRCSFFVLICICSTWSGDSYRYFCFAFCYLPDFFRYVCWFCGCSFVRLIPLRSWVLRLFLFSFVAHRSFYVLRFVFRSLPTVTLWSFSFTARYVFWFTFDLVIFLDFFFFFYVPPHLVPRLRSTRCSFTLFVTFTFSTHCFSDFVDFTILWSCIFRSRCLRLSISLRSTFPFVATVRFIYWSRSYFVYTFGAFLRFCCCTFTTTFYSFCVSLFVTFVLPTRSLLFCGSVHSVDFRSFRTGLRSYVPYLYVFFTFVVCTFDSRSFYRSFVHVFFVVCTFCSYGCVDSRFPTDFVLRSSFLECFVTFPLLFILRCCSHSFWFVVVWIHFLLRSNSYVNFLLFCIHSLLLLLLSYFTICLFVYIRFVQSLICRRFRFIVFTFWFPCVYVVVWWFWLNFCVTPTHSSFVTRYVYSLVQWNSRWFTFLPVFCICSIFFFVVHLFVYVIPSLSVVTLLFVVVLLSLFVTLIHVFFFLECSVFVCSFVCLVILRCCLNHLRFHFDFPVLLFGYVQSTIQILIAFVDLFVFTDVDLFVCPRCWWSYHVLRVPTTFCVPGCVCVAFPVYILCCVDPDSPVPHYRLLTLVWSFLSQMRFSGFWISPRSLIFFFVLFLVLVWSVPVTTPPLPYRPLGSSYDFTFFFFVTFVHSFYVCCIPVLHSTYLVPILVISRLRFDCWLRFHVYGCCSFHVRFFFSFVWFVSRLRCFRPSGVLFTLISRSYRSSALRCIRCSLLLVFIHCYIPFCLFIHSLYSLWSICLSFFLRCCFVHLQYNYNSFL